MKTQTIKELCKTKTTLSLSLQPIQPSSSFLTKSLASSLLPHQNRLLPSFSNAINSSSLYYRSEFLSLIDLSLPLLNAYKLLATLFFSHGSHLAATLFFSLYEDLNFLGHPKRNGESESGVGDSFTFGWFICFGFLFFLLLL